MAGFAIEVVLTFFFLLIILAQLTLVRPKVLRQSRSDSRLPDSLDQYSRHKHFGKSCAQPWTSSLCGRVGVDAAVALLGSAVDWSRACGSDLSDRRRITGVVT
jgi:hypothetical protein